MGDNMQLAGFWSAEADAKWLLLAESTGPLQELFQTPRVNGAVLGQFVGRTVCVVGKVLSHQEGAGEARLQTSDGHEIHVQVAPGSSWSSQYVEVIGHLHDELSLQEFKSTDFGDSFDTAMYNKAVELMTGKMSNVFYSAQE